MATARDIITRALRRAKIVADGMTPAAEQVAGALDTLNEMLAAWRTEEGIILPLELPLGVDDVIDVDLASHRAIINNLAVEAGDDAGVAISPALVARAERSRASLVARHFGSPNAPMDLALRRKPVYDPEIG